MADFKKQKLALNNFHASQLNKLAFKSEADIELMETVRDYFRSRAELEMHHSKALEKLSKTISQKKFRKFLGNTPAPLFIQSLGPERPVSPLMQSPESAKQEQPEPQPQSALPSSQSSISSSKVYQSFRNLLIETELQAKSRASLAESMNMKISEFLKEFDRQKAGLTKRNLEFGVKYQHEIILALDEMERTRMVYEKAAKDHESSHKKYDDLIKKPKGGLSSFKTMVTGKDANSVKEHYKAKIKNRLRHMHDARNNYLLAIASYNSITDLYETEDLSLLMSKVDGNYYTTFSEMLLKYTDFETGLSQNIDESMGRIQNQLKSISRSEELKLFLEEFKNSFAKKPRVQFEAVGIDDLRNIYVDDVTKIALGQKLGKMLGADSSLITQQENKEKELIGAQKVLDLYIATEKNEKVPANGITPIELVTDILNSLDLIKCKRIKYAEQMSSLRKLNIVPIMPDNSDASAGKQMALVKFKHIPESDDQLEANEGDELEILENGPEGFVKARNTSSGATGTIPASYILLILKAPIKSVSKIVVALYDRKAEEEHEVSFNVGDEIKCTGGFSTEEEWWEGEVLRTKEVGAFPKSFTKGWENVASQIGGVISASRPSSKFKAAGESPQNAQENSTAASSIAEDFLEDNKPDQNDSQEVLHATALYTYNASCEGELTIEAGEVITDICKDSGDDQWWHGKGKHGEGQFPQNYVSVLETFYQFEVKALYDFSPTSPGELSFKAGDVLLVIQAEEEDWWDGELNGVEGAFPAAYVEKIAAE